MNRTLSIDPGLSPLRTRSAHSQQGASMIEVLVLIFIMAVGMMGMSKMHTVLIRDGGTANNRAIATSLAQEKIDDLRSFTWRDNAQALANSQNCANTSVYCFSEMATNAGGRLAAGSVTLGNTAFTLSWTVTPATNFNQVVVTVAWTDQNGNDAVQLNASIYRDGHVIQAFNPPGGGGGGVGGQGPRVAYTQGIAPDAVPVPILQGEVNKETSKPLPDVVSAGKSVATSFETVTYKASGTTTKQIVSDFVTISCVCKFTTDGAGYPASYYYWDSDHKAIQVKYPLNQHEGTAQTITKRRGVPDASGQHPLCDKCCNDHHDKYGDSTTALYDPSRPAGDYRTGSGESGNHKHYYYVNESNPAQGLVEVAETNNQKYLESCRFLRVDGFYRLMQDWVAKDLIVMPKDNYLTNSATLGTYQEYVRNVLRYWARTDCSSAGASGCTGINQANLPSKSSLVQRNISNQTSGSVQLLSRALYLDSVYQKNAPRTLDAAYYTYLAGRIVANQSTPNAVWLDIVPFNEVNTTLLTSWYSSDSSKITVTNAPIVDVGASAANYYGVYSRGLATVTAAGNANIHAVLLPSNSGLTGGAKQESYSSTKDYDSNTLAELATAIPYSSQIGIDRHDHSSALRKTDFINISTTATAGIAGEVRAGNAAGATFLGQITVSAQPSSGAAVACTLSGEGNVRGFSCPISSGFTGTVRITQTSGSGAFFDHGMDIVYDDESSGGFQDASGSLGPVTGPTNGGVFWVFANTAEVRGTLACGEVCSQVKVSSSAGACTFADGAVRCPVPLTGSSKTWSGSVTIENLVGHANNLGAVLGDGSCTPSGSTAKSVSIASAGPTDRPSAFTLCASSGGSLAQCTLDGTTIPSGSSLTAYKEQSVNYPATCTAPITRTCTNGVLSGDSSYIYVSPCVQRCTVPNVVGQSVTGGLVAVNNLIIGAGFVPSSSYVTSGTNGQVTTQSPTAATVTSCGGGVSYEYRCTTTISGSMPNASTTPSISVAGGGGSCTKSGSNYTCNANSPPGAAITVTRSGASKNFAANCGVYSGQNF